MEYKAASAAGERIEWERERARRLLITSTDEGRQLTLVLTKINARHRTSECREEVVLLFLLLPSSSHLLPTSSSAGTTVSNKYQCHNDFYLEI